MEIRTLSRSEIGEIAWLVAAFRVTLQSYKGVKSEPNYSDAKKELEGYFDSNFPVYGAFVDEEYIGYAVCRVDAPCIWMESLFVDSAHRRKGVASALFAKAEELAAFYNEDTVYNYVHPNNECMLSFLTSSRIQRLEPHRNPQALYR